MDRFRSILLFLFAFVSFTSFAQTATPAARQDNLHQGRDDSLTRPLTR